MLLIFAYFLLLAATPNEVSSKVEFTPPTGWRMAQTDQLPKSVQVMVVGKGGHEMPPSIYLTTEQFNGTLKGYLEIVKQINKAKGNEWKDLGTLKTESGMGSLSQAEMETQWGKVRMMHVILLKDGTIYNLTAAALTSEFSMFYKDFFTSLRSLAIKNL
jgi:hypothetical protein